MDKLFLYKSAKQRTKMIADVIAAKIRTPAHFERFKNTVTEAHARWGTRKLVKEAGMCRKPSEAFAKYALAIDRYSEERDPEAITIFEKAAWAKASFRHGPNGDHAKMDMEFANSIVTLTCLARDFARKGMPHQAADAYEKIGEALKHEDPLGAADYLLAAAGKRLHAEPVQAMQLAETAILLIEGNHPEWAAKMRNGIVLMASQAAEKFASAGRSLEAGQIFEKCGLIVNAHDERRAMGVFMRAYKNYLDAKSPLAAGALVNAAKIMVKKKPKTAYGMLLSGERSLVEVGCLGEARKIRMLRVSKLAEAGRKRMEPKRPRVETDVRLEGAL